MRNLRLPHDRDRAVCGFTLIEVMIALTLLSMVGYVSALALRASERSHATVSSAVVINEAIRDTTGKLRGELRAARRGSITLVDLASGDRSLEFQSAIRAAGGPAWGAFDRRLAIDEDACHKDGWTIKYTVQVNGAGDKKLVRQIRDVGGTLQFAEDLVTGVETFRVTESGSVWLVELTTEGDHGKRHEEFDVRTRDN